MYAKKAVILHRKIGSQQKYTIKKYEEVISYSRSLLVRLSDGKHATSVFHLSGDAERLALPAGTAAG